VNPVRRTRRTSRNCPQWAVSQASSRSVSARVTGRGASPLSTMSLQRPLACVLQLQVEAPGRFFSPSRAAATLKVNQVSWLALRHSEEVAGVPP
jgi:hypothetical protein